MTGWFMKEEDGTSKAPLPLGEEMAAFRMLTYNMYL